MPPQNSLQLVIECEPFQTLGMVAEYDPKKYSEVQCWAIYNTSINSPHRNYFLQSIDHVFQTSFSKQYQHDDTFENEKNSLARK